MEIPVEIVKKKEQKEDLLEIGVLGSGQKVFDRPNSHFHSSGLYDKNLLKDVFAKISVDKDFKGAFLKEEVAFDRIIGESSCVVTDANDSIVFAQRSDRKGGFTRFVIGKEKEKTSVCTVVLKRVDGGFILLTGYVGASAPPEPWDYNAEEGSKNFWRSHALVWGSEPTIPGTEYYVQQGEDVTSKFW